MQTEPPLRSGQLFIRDEIRRERKALVAVRMAGGKTAAVLKAVREELDSTEIRRVLVAAPWRVTRETWPVELEKWSFARAMTWTLIEGTPAQRERLLKRDTEIHIINRELLPWLWRYWKAHGGFPYDGLVYDEASRMKEGKKKTGKGRISEFGALSNMRPFLRLVIELSGTPAPGGLHQLWGPMYIIDGGERLGSDRTAFERRWFDKGYMGYDMKPFPHSHVEIMDRVADKIIVLRPEDHVDMPPTIPNNLFVTLPPEIMAQYRRFRREMVSEEYDVEAPNKGVLESKLLQFANGSMYRWNDLTEDGRRQREEVHVHDLKIEALDSVMTEAQGESVLVAYNFRFDLGRIKKFFPRAVIFEDEPNAVKLWNAGKIRMLVAHPASMGHGLNMQFGGHIACWFGLTWSLELYEQFNARLPRPGNASEHVYINHILARGTEDEAVLAALVANGATQESIFEAVRQRRAA